MNKHVTVLSLKDEIIKSYGHVYFEWSKQLDVELEVAHAILIGCNCQVWRTTLFEFDYFRCLLRLTPVHFLGIKIKQPSSIRTNIFTHQSKQI